MKCCPLTDCRARHPMWWHDRRRAPARDRLLPGLDPPKHGQR